MFRVPQFGLAFYDWIFLRSQGASGSWLYAGAYRELFRTNVCFGQFRHKSWLILQPHTLPTLSILGCDPQQDPTTLDSFAVPQTHQASSDFKGVFPFLSSSYIFSAQVLPSKWTSPIKIAHHSWPRYSDSPFTLLYFTYSTYPIWYIANVCVVCLLPQSVSSMNITTVCFIHYCFPSVSSAWHIVDTL